MRHNSKIVLLDSFSQPQCFFWSGQKLKNAEIEGERVNSLNWQGILRTDRPCLACQPPSQSCVRPRGPSAGPIYARRPLIIRMESENLFHLTPSLLLSFTQGDHVRDGCLWKGFREAAAFISSATLPSAKIHWMHCHCSRDPKFGLTWHLNLNRVDPLWTLSVTTSLPGVLSTR